MQQCNRMKLEEFNRQSDKAASTALLQCCSSETWVRRMLQTRPFSAPQQLLNQASKHWWNLQEQDYLQAFEGHPKIGDVNSLREKYASTKALASGEQGGVAGASEEVYRELSAGNREYEERNGFIFIVCATGKGADEMLAMLQARLANTRAEEIKNACVEQEKITALRLQKMLSETTEK